MLRRGYMGRYYFFPGLVYKGKEYSCHTIENPFAINIFRFLKSLFIIISLIIPNLTFAIPSNTTFKNLTTEMGLSHGDVTCFCQDYEGYMWVGTRDGLNRFDGLKFTVFKNNQKDTTSLPNNQIDYIFEDSKKNLWIGVGNGLCRFNREKNNFEKINYTDDNNEDLHEHGIVTIFEDSSKRLWLGSNNNGVYWLDEENKKLHNFKNKDITCVLSTAIKQDKRGNIWFSFRDNPVSEGGLVKYNPESGETEWFNSKHPVYKINDIYSITIDDHDNIWIGSSSGLYMINEDKKSFTLLNKGFNSLNNKLIHFLTTSTKGDILIGSDGGGLIIFNPETRSFNSIFYSESKGSLLSNTIYSIFVANDGVIWIGCWGAGISIYDDRFNKFQTFRQEESNSNSISGKSVTSFAEDKNGNIWISTDGGGINFFNPETKKISNFKNVKEDYRTLTNDKVLALCTDNNGNLWSGMWNGGLNIFKIENDKLILKEKFRNVNPSSNNYSSIFNLYCDDEGKIWVGCYETGAFLFNNKTKTFKSVGELLKSPQKVNTFYNINDFLTDGDFIWIASEYNGLMRFNIITGEYRIFKHDPNDSLSIGENTIHSLLKDKSNRIWAGTDKGGLSLFNKQTETFQSYTIEDGLPDNTILGILESNNGDLWISSNNGISKISISDSSESPRLKFRNYSVKDGLQGSVFNRWSYFKSSTGEMYFGGLNGFNVFHPDSVIDNTFIPPVHFTDFLLYNKNVEIGGKDSPLKKHISMTDEIVLHYNQNYFTLKFIALNFIFSENNQYAYYMEGFEKEWNYTREKTEATYTNLEPGQYIFKVKASNNDGIWNEEGISVKITILPPWWKTLWFKILTVLLLAGILLSYYYYRISSIKKINIKLKQLVEERTIEIENQNKVLIKQSNELKLSNSLLEERQKLIEDQSEELMAQKNELIKINTELNDLNATKDKFFLL